MSFKDYTYEISTKLFLFLNMANGMSQKIKRANEYKYHLIISFVRIEVTTGINIINIKIACNVNIHCINASIKGNWIKLNNCIYNCIAGKLETCYTRGKELHIEHYWNVICRKNA